MAQSLGQLQQLVMLAVARLGENAYGAAIQRELELVAGCCKSIASVYITLIRLEKDGLVSSSQGPPVSGRGGRRKRYFKVTKRGWEALESTREAVHKLWQGLQAPAWIGKGSTD